MKKKAIFAMLAGGLLAATAWGADVPKTVIYEGVLSDPVEGALAGAQTIDARLYEQLTEGVAMWDGTLHVTVAEDGSFQLALSDDAKNPMSKMSLVEALAKPACFLELHVEGHGDAIAPRIPLASVPQVMAATYASQSPIGFIVAGDLKVAEKLSVKGDVVVGATNGTPATLRANKLTVGGNGTVGGSVTTTGAARAARLEIAGSVPVGGIVIWDDNWGTIPSGWEYFANLQERFPVGVGDGYPLGAKGGENWVTLTVNQLPRHTHTYEIGARFDFGRSGLAWKDKDWFKDKGSTRMGSTGNTKSHENRPPFRALYYIIRVR